MAEEFLKLPRSDQAAAFDFVGSRTGRPAYILEKDVWVLWSLSVLFGEQGFGQHLVFKGGTSLSKAYKAIDRFSEDVDLTYDIRHMLPDVPDEGDGMPPSGSKARKWNDEARRLLPQWIEGDLTSFLDRAIREQALPLVVEQETKEKLKIRYEPLAAPPKYIAPEIKLEFGARSTGEPAEAIDVACDMAPHLTDYAFPTARPRVMALERTFWEKATAAHVYCLQARLKGERFARHWYDLAALARHPRYRSALGDRTLAEQVARHKSYFFAEKDQAGQKIDYVAAVSGSIVLCPEGGAAESLEGDYHEMCEASLPHGEEMTFADLMARCRAIEQDINAAGRVAQMPDQGDEAVATG